MLRNLSFFLVAILLTQQLHAHDANYWASGYGAGPVIVNNYNKYVLLSYPALLANDRQNASSISGTIYGWKFISKKNGAGFRPHLISSNKSSVYSQPLKNIPASRNTSRLFHC